MIGLINDPYMLGGLGLAIAFYVMFTFALLIGFNAIITVFTSQLLGMGKIKETALYLNAARFCNVFLCVPLMILLCFAYPIFIFIGQDELVSYYAAQFCYGVIPGVIPIAMATLHGQHLNSFRRGIPGVIACCTGLASQVFCSWLLMFKVAEWELLGAGLAVSFSNIVQAGVIHVALYYYDDVRATL
jgi:Na+-driven multidrug efflux pump